MKMKYILVLISCITLSCSQVTSDTSIQEASVTTQPNKIIIVWFENKPSDSIVNSINAPYINTLIPQGTLFTNYHGITHPSQRNYIGFFAGDTLGVGDACLGNNFTNENLYTKLKPTKFCWYSEGLPNAGSTKCKSGEYRRRHNPTPNFSNVIGKFANKPFSAFPTNFNLLEDVVCISPNLLNDMHDGTVKQGDTWLQNNMMSLINWCKTNNSIFLVYYDEGKDVINEMPVMMIGEHIKQNYQSSIWYNHYSLCKTICSLYSADTTWTASLIKAKTINDIWQ